MLTRFTRQVRLTAPQVLQRGPAADGPARAELLLRPLSDATRLHKLLQVCLHQRLHVEVRRLRRMSRSLPQSLQRWRWTACWRLRAPLVRQVQVGL